MHDSLKIIVRTLPSIIAALLCLQSIAGQTGCLSADEVKAMLAQVTSHQKVAFNKKLSDRLIELKRQNEQHVQRDVIDNRKTEDLIKTMKADRAKNALEL